VLRIPFRRSARTTPDAPGTTHVLSRQECDDDCDDDERHDLTSLA
jgi:hypothetical protein